MKYSVGIDKSTDTRNDGITAQLSNTLQFIHAYETHWAML